MKTLVLRVVLSALCALVLSVPAIAQTAAGAIKAVRVQGEVSKLTKDGQSVALTEGARLTESDTVVTGRSSSVVLVFMNGSTIRLAPESKLSIDEFKMDPLDSAIKVSELTAEPSKSKTELNLSYGELVGEVKTLNKAAGSTYNIKTPVGAAGIRGTTFRIVFQPTGDGKAFTFTLSTAEGVVLFTGTVAGTGNPVDVPQNQEVVVTANVDPNTGVITVSAPVSTQPISPEAASAIQEAATAIIQTQQQTNFSTGDQQSGSTPPANNTPTGTQPTAQPTTLRTTPGDGSG